MCALIARVRVDDLCAATHAVVCQTDAYNRAKYHFPSCHLYSHAHAGIPGAAGYDGMRSRSVAWRWDWNWNWWKWTTAWRYIQYTVSQFQYPTYLQMRKTRRLSRRSGLNHHFWHSTLILRFLNSGMLWLWHGGILSLGKSQSGKKI